MIKRRKKTRTLMQRFYDSMKVDESGCWLWTKRINDKGYGVTAIEGKKFKAHRVSYMLFKGEIPIGMVVCHSCDIPACVNPDHLWIGTQKENLMDMSRKRRNLRGDNHKSTKIPSYYIGIIKEACACGFTQDSIASYFKVSQSAISIIHLNKRAND